MYKFPLAKSEENRLTKARNNSKAFFRKHPKAGLILELVSVVDLIYLDIYTITFTAAVALSFVLGYPESDPTRIGNKLEKLRQNKR